MIIALILIALKIVIIAASILIALNDNDNNSTNIDSFRNLKKQGKGKTGIVTLHLQIDSLVAEHWLSHSYANTSYKRKLHWTLHVPRSIGLIFTCLPIFIDLPLSANHSVCISY